MIKATRLPVLGLFVLSIMALAGCDDTTDITIERFRPAAVIVRIDTQAVTIAEDSIARDTLVVEEDEENIVTFTFLNAAGDTIDAIPNDTTFAVVVQPASSALTYTPLTNVSGVLVGNDPGNTSFSVSLRRRNVTVFGPVVVPVFVDD